jgi:hypothetical protein
MKTLFIVLIASCTICWAQIDSIKVYWVGHSLISGKDWTDPDAKNLMELLGPLADSSSKKYEYYKHTTPGAPIGWNWGVEASWEGMESKIAPLTDETHSDYGSFNAIVVTEGVNIESSYDWWSSGFYARKFYNAARAANGSTRLYLYESWHHYYASDRGFASYYGDQIDFDWLAYMKSVRSIWTSIADEAADPNLTPVVNDYVYQGEGDDPGNGDDSLEVYIVPTGKVFIEVIERLNEKRIQDNWSFTDGIKGDTLVGDDFFLNPLTDFPTDLVTTVTGSDVDDIHPSDVLIYLNALTHYAVLYQSNPSDLPTTKYVPEAIADIFKEVVWEVVTNDPYTGVTQEGSLTNSKKIADPIFIKNQVKNYNANGQVQQVICGVQGVCLNKF